MGADKRVIRCRQPVDQYWPGTRCARRCESTFMADRYSVSRRCRAHLPPHFSNVRGNTISRPYGMGSRPNAKQALGVSSNDAGAALRQKITQLALTRRTAIAQVVDALPLWSGYTSPMRLADRPVTGVGAVKPDPMLINTSHDVVVRRALELYPLHSPVQDSRPGECPGDQRDCSADQNWKRCGWNFRTIRQVLSPWVSRQNLASAARWLKAGGRQESANIAPPRRSFAAGAMSPSSPSPATSSFPR